MTEEKFFESECVCFLSKGRFAIPLPPYIGSQEDPWFCNL